MFQVSRRADYAVRIMVDLGLRKKRPSSGESQRTAAQEVAKSTAVPKAFLHKISADLVKAGLLRTYSGPAGGLELARPTANISMREILEAIEGPLCLNSCLLRPQECPRDHLCPAHSFWGRLQISILKQLEETTLELLVEEALALRKGPRQQEIPYLYPNHADFVRREEIGIAHPVAK